MELTSPGSSGHSSLCLSDPLLPGPTAYLSSFFCFYLLPLLPPSSWSYLSPCLSPTFYLSHLLLFLPSTVLPVPEPLHLLAPLLGTSQYHSSPCHTPRHPLHCSLKWTSDFRLSPGPQDEPCSRTALWTFPLQYYHNVCFMTFL